MTIASTLFEARLAFGAAEEKVSNLLTECLGEFDDFSHDYYDESIEVYGCKPSPLAWDVLHAAGFKRVWLHPHVEGKPDKLTCGCKTSRPS